MFAVISGGTLPVSYVLFQNIEEFLPQALTGLKYVKFTTTTIACLALPLLPMIGTALMVLQLYQARLGVGIGTEQC